MNRRGGDYVSLSESTALERFLEFIMSLCLLALLLIFFGVI